ncbi:uncharacterized protein LOC125943305 [Dermacentor silvarum]|uniref:uncharacterized protein LOC125943305 n=1 Tax=Dermacentor silvarum TaxID=543639 RepID=UPI0021011F97|nr:uncharacterized protein LOC125943305 [Dermacentor silvarum]
MQRKSARKSSTSRTSENQKAQSTAALSAPQKKKGVKRKVLGDLPLRTANSEVRIGEESSSVPQKQERNSDNTGVAAKKETSQKVGQMSKQNRRTRKKSCSKGHDSSPVEAAPGCCRGGVLKPEQMDDGASSGEGAF